MWLGGVCYSAWEPEADSTFFNKLPLGRWRNFTVSSKNCSLAIEEVKEQSQEKTYENDFEPKLKILVNKRLINNSGSVEDAETVSIGGRITISFWTIERNNDWIQSGHRKMAAFFLYMFTLPLKPRSEPDPSGPLPGNNTRSYLGEREEAKDTRRF